jgi:hypothetical protein
MQTPVTCCALQTSFTQSQVLDSRAAPTVCPVQELSRLRQTNDNYGFSSAVSEDQSVLAVGAPLYKFEDKPVGAVFVYNLVRAEYILQQVFLHPLLQEFSGFGGNIAMSANGRTFIVTASGENEFAGAAYAYERKNCAVCFSETEKLVSAESAEQKSFGRVSSLSPDGSVAMVSDEEKVQIFVKKSRNSKFESVGTLLFDSEIASQLFGKKVVLSSATVITLTKNGKLAAVGMRNAEIEDVVTGGVLIFARSACDEKWILVDFLADWPEDRIKSRIGEDVKITPNGKDLIVFSGTVDQNNPSADAAFTIVYSLKNKHFQFTQFIVPSATQIPLFQPGISLVNISDSGCFLTIAYACANENKGEIEIFSRRSNQKLFETFQTVQSSSGIKLGASTKLSGNGKALFALNLTRREVDQIEFFDYEVRVFNSKKFFTK